MATRLLQGGVTDLGLRHEGYTPLMLAARYDHTETCLALLLGGGGGVNEADAKGFSALSWAARHGCLGTVALLLNHGAEVDWRDHRGGTPLLWAKAFGHTAVSRVLVGAGAATGVATVDGISITMLERDTSGEKLARLLRTFHGEKWGGPQRTLLEARMPPLPTRTPHTAHSHDARLQAAEDGDVASIARLVGAPAPISEAPLPGAGADVNLPDAEEACPPLVPYKSRHTPPERSHP